MTWCRPAARDGSTASLPNDKGSVWEASGAGLELMQI